MRTFATLAACAAVVVGQEITATGPPMGVYQTDVWQPAVTATTVIGAAAASSAIVEKRQATTCVAQPTGIAHTSTPDTPAAFEADIYYSGAALSAISPAGYTAVFTNTNASNNANGYQGFTLLSSYDVESCASQCNAISGCNSFNIYFERDPSVNPDSPSCSNPSSVTNIKCVWWNGLVSVSNDDNYGQWRDDFEVVIAGSNGYVNITAASAASSTSSSASAAATSAIDDNGSAYNIYFSSDSTQGAFSSSQATNSYADCMDSCDSTATCAAFTYVGGANGVGSGTCWLKTAFGSASASGDNYVSGVRTSSGSASSSSSSSSASSSSSSSSSLSSSNTSSSTSSSTPSSSNVATSTVAASTVSPASVPSTSSSFSTVSSSTASFTPSSLSSTSSTSSSSTSSSSSSTISSSSAISSSSLTTSSPSKPATTSSSSSSSSILASTSSSTTTLATAVKPVPSSSSSSSTTQVSSTSTTPSPTSTATTMVTSTKAASSSSSSSSTTASTSKSSSSTTSSSSATSTPFYIQITGTGTSADSEYLVVASGSNGAATFVKNSSAASKFVIDAFGDLVEQNPTNGYAANVVLGNGYWQKVAWNSLNSGAFLNYASCGLSGGNVACSLNNVAASAGVCNGDGYLYLGYSLLKPALTCSSATLVAVAA